MISGKGKSLLFRLLLLSACFLTPTLTAAQELRVGLYENPPKVFTGDQGQPRGLLIDILEEIASREGWQLNYVPCEWQGCLNLLEAGELDLMPDVAINTARQELFSFHRVPALSSWSQIYSHPDAEIFSLLDLSGKRIAVLESSVQEPALQALLEGFDVDFQSVAASSLEEAFEWVAAGDADAAIANYQFGVYRADALGLKETPIVFMPARLFYATPRGENQQLLATLDTYLERWRIQNDSPYYQVLRRWGGSSPETLMPEGVRTALFGLTSLGVLLLVGVLLLRVQVKRRTAELRALNEHLEQLAHYDLLTGLPNRILLTERLDCALREADKHRQLLLVAFIDLDGFKQINDRHGTGVGDRLLLALSRELRCHLGHQDLLSRTGGDEFVVVMTQLNTEASGLQRVSQLLNCLAQPVHLGELQLQVSGSIGLCFYPQEEAQTPETLLRQADQAMYQAKLEGKNGFYVFDTEKDRHARGQYETLERIRQGLNDEELVLYYQPKVNLRSGEVVGAEALIRWQHPERGLLPPAVFLPLIDGQPLDVDLGYWVLKTALQQMQTWQDMGLQLPVSVNISAFHLQQPDFVEQLVRQLQEFPQIRPEDLELEVLETSALEDVEKVSEVMRACKKLGVGFALDDFGTGYSSLTYLRRLPAGMLKIDRTFVRDLLIDEEDRAILEGVIRLAQVFERQVIAEGVETRAHGDRLLELGCELAQGYGIARPLPAYQLVEWVKSWQQAPQWTDSAYTLEK